MEKSNTLQTIAAYDKNAVKYAEKFDNYEIYQNKIRDFQRKHVARRSHILDLGCGPGNNIATMLNQDATCIFEGIDLSREFINIAQQRFPNFIFHLKNICDFDLESAYDVVLASFCIVHLTDTEAANFIKKLPTLIRNDGYLYLSYMNGERSGFESTSFSKEKIFFNYYRDEFILEHLAHAGISALEISKEEYAEPDGSTTVDTFIFAKKESAI